MRSVPDPPVAIPAAAPPGRRGAAVDGGAPGRPVVAVLVAPRTPAGLDACASALRSQRGAPIPHVTVVEPPSTGRAEEARAHPLVDRVVLGTDTAPGALVGRALWAQQSAAAAVVAVVDPEVRPGPDWVRSALAALGPGVAAVWAPATGGSGIFVDVVALRSRRELGGMPIVPGGDHPADVRRWLEDAGLRCVEVRSGDAASGSSTDPPPHLRVVPAPGAPGGGGAAYAGLVSVIVCSHRRPAALARCLASLRELDDPRHEVVVVDNGATPQYERAAIEAAGARYVHEPRRGLDNARNRGLAEARGAIVAYVDDDCEVRPDWLHGLRRAFGDPAVGLVAGRVVAASLALPSERWFEAWFGFDRGPLADHCTRDDPRPSAALYPSLLGTGANMAYRREVLERIGGFDELLDVGAAVGGGGDIDAFARVLDTGAVGRYEPDAVVVHHHRTTMTALRRQFFGYGQALGALCVKYALDRPGHKRAAVRFYLRRLRDQARRGVPRPARTSALPLALTLTEVAGQLHGPAAYLLARRRAARATGREGAR